MKWRSKHNIESFSEEVLLAYFNELSCKIKPSSLWATYSMLRATINIYQEKINIANHHKLLAFLKMKAEGFKSTKSKTFTVMEIRNFLQNAPDSKYLLMKVILIIGISGACKKKELRNVLAKNVEDTGRCLVIKVSDSKTKAERTFVVPEKLYPICKKYMELRPENDDNSSFFLNYQNERCTRQSVGINTFGYVPRKIAQYLGIPDPEKYTGHCFRRSSSTVLVDPGGEFLPLQPESGHSSSVAENCFKNSMCNSSTSCTEVSNEITSENVYKKEHDDNKKGTNLSELNLNSSITSLNGSILKVNQFGSDPTKFVVKNEYYDGSDVYFKESNEDSVTEDSKSFIDQFIDEKDIHLEPDDTFENCSNKMSDDSDDCTITEINDRIKEGNCSSLPPRSKKRYDVMYERFMDWRSKHNIESFSEEVLLDYFEELSGQMKPSSLWSTYSMLRATINVYQEKINIADYPKLNEFLRTKSKDFEAKKSKTLTAMEIQNFLQNAPDSKYLLSKVNYELPNRLPVRRIVKEKLDSGKVLQEFVANVLQFKEKIAVPSLVMVILIIGISGACRKQEIRNIIFKNVEDTGKLLIIKIPDARTKTERAFVVSEKWYPTCKKYMNLRPENDENLPFFLNYQNEKCNRQSVGINTIGNTPRKIAQYLGIPDAEKYTGHCFRRSSATLLVDTGGAFLSLEQQNKSKTISETVNENLSKNRHRSEEGTNLARHNLNSLSSSSTGNTLNVNQFEYDSTKLGVKNEFSDDTEMYLENSCEQSGSATEDSKSFTDQFVDAKEMYWEPGDSFENCSEKKPDESGDCMLSEINEGTKDGACDSLPPKSRKRYDLIYERFMDWRSKNDIESFSEEILLNYFRVLSGEMKPSSLWATYSMLKATINVYQENVYIGDYKKLIKFLKGKSKGFETKKSKIFTATEMHNFLQNAPDSKQLLRKVIMIIGISGACGKQELRNITPHNVEDTGTCLVIKIPDARTKTERAFVVPEKWYPICKKYMKLRTKNDGHLPFFLNYQNEKCNRQSVGINTIGNTPKKIAHYLGIPDADKYTGNCFRRSSATVLADSNGDLLSLKNQGGWESSSVAEGYIDISMNDSSSSLTELSSAIINEKVSENKYNSEMERNSTGNGLTFITSSLSQSASTDNSTFVLNNCTYTINSYPR